MDKPSKNDVILTQHISPSGRLETVWVDVGEELATIAKNMTLSCEVLRTNDVAVYGRLKGTEEEDELCELCANGPSDFTPRDAVIKIIKTLSALKENNI